MGNHAQSHAPIYEALERFKRMRSSLSMSPDIKEDVETLNLWNY